MAHVYVHIHIHTNTRGDTFRRRSMYIRTRILLSLSPAPVQNRRTTRDSRFCVAFVCKTCLQRESRHRKVCCADPVVPDRMISPRCSDRESRQRDFLTLSFLSSYASTVLLPVGSSSSVVLHVCSLSPSVSSPCFPPFHFTHIHLSFLHLSCLLFECW